MEAHAALEFLRSAHGLMAAGAAIQVAIIRYGMGPRGMRWWVYHAGATATGLLIAHALAG